MTEYRVTTIIRPNYIVITDGMHRMMFYTQTERFFVVSGAGLITTTAEKHTLPSNWVAV